MVMNLCPNSSLVLHKKRNHQREDCWDGKEFAGSNSTDDRVRRSNITAEYRSGVGGGELLSWEAIEGDRFF